MVMTASEMRAYANNAEHRQHLQRYVEESINSLKTLIDNKCEPVATVRHGNGVSESEVLSELLKLGYKSWTKPVNIGGVIQEGEFFTF